VFEPNFGAASFCGKVCDMETLTIIADPVKFIRKFFALPPHLAYASESKRLAYLRAKAMSATVTYVNCPVITPLVHQVLDLTRGYDVRGVHLGHWKQGLLDLAIEGNTWRKSPVVVDNTIAREHMASTFGISVEMQLALERVKITEPTRIDITDLLSGEDVIANELYCRLPGQSADDVVPRLGTVCFPKSLYEERRLDSAPRRTYNDTARMDYPATEWNWESVRTAQDTLQKRRRVTQVSAA
jgi:hypothetical protein